MRIFLLFVFCLGLLPARAQYRADARINLSVNGADLQWVLNNLSKQCGIVFSFDPSEVDVQQKIHANIKNSTLPEALSVIGKNSGFAYRLYDKYAILHPGEKPTTSPTSAAKSDKNIIDAQSKKNRQTAETEKGIKSKSLVREQYIYSRIDMPDFFSPSSSGSIDSACHSSVTKIRYDMQTKEFSQSEKQMESKKKFHASQISDILRRQIALLMVGLGIAQATAQTPEHAPETKIKNRPESVCVEVVATRPAQLSFVSPVGTDWIGTANNSYSFSLNMLGGINAGVSGVEFGGLYNINRGAMTGAQFAGLFNMNTCKVTGIQFAGLFNVNTCNVTGIQFAGLFNTARGGDAVLQSAGIFNYAKQGAKVQLSGIYNQAEQSKVQISTINVLKKGGFQLGVVNIRDTADGIMLGLLNIAKKGGLFEIELAGGLAQLTAGNISLRTGTERLYGILSFGYSFSNSSDAEFWGYGLGLGTSFRLNEKWKIDIEAIETMFLDQNFNSKYTNIQVQLRPLLSYQLSPRLSLFAGPGINLFISSNSIDNPLRSIAPYSFFDHSGSRNNVQAWIGGTSGLRLRLFNN